MVSFIAKCFAFVFALILVIQVQAQAQCAADGDCTARCPDGQYAGCWFAGEMGGDSTCHCFYSHDFGIGEIKCADCP